MNQRNPEAAVTPRTLFLPLAATLLLVAVPSVYFAGGLGDASPQHWDAYLALERSIGLLRTGDWLTLHYNFEPDFKKPPLQYMLTAGLITAGIDQVLALRVWSFTFAVGSLLLTGVLAGLTAPGRWWVIPSSVALLAGSPVLWTHSRIGLLESGQVFFLLLTFCFAILAERDSRWWIPTGIAVGLGFLQKTPLALVSLVFWLWIRNRLDSGEDFSRSRLRENENFRVGRRIALTLCILWPAIQIVRHGSQFIDAFFLEQMVFRFAPTTQIDTGSFQWLEWLARDLPQVWCPALALIPVVLCLPRFRANVDLRGMAWLVAACLLVLTLAGGTLFSRYILVILPFLAVIASIALAELLPAKWIAPTISAALLASSVPNLLVVPESSHRHDRSELIEMSQRFRERLRPTENPILVDRGADLNIHQPGFVHHASLDRRILRSRVDRLDQFKRMAAARGMSGPYLGLSVIADLEVIKFKLGAIEEVDRMTYLAIWRLPKLRDASTNPK